MKTYWMFTPWPPIWRNGGYFLGRYDFLNAGEMLPARPPAGEFARNAMPVAQLQFAVEDIADDCLPLGVWTLVSEKMRHAMALGPSDIQYFDVDTVQSPALPRSKHYKIMHVPVKEDVSDPDRSDYTFRQRPDGSTKLFGDPDAVAFRPDADPVHEIFYDRFFNIIYCTDEFAMRVLEAGCTGMRFLDSVAPFGAHRGYHRTLRGVEEDEWDPRLEIYRSKVIREIP
jgi:hypothetical protein